MYSERTPANFSRGLVLAASVVVIFAGLRAARSILVPVMVAVFIAVVCAPLVFWMRKKGVPKLIAIATVFVGISAVGTGLAIFVGEALTDFILGLPRYQLVLAEQISELMIALEALGVSLPEDQFELNPAVAFSWVTILLNSIRSLFTNGFLIGLIIIFILLEASGFETKLNRALKNPEMTLQRYATFAEGVKRYFVIKTLISGITGLALGLWLMFIGIEHALLWGLLAFLLNYIPVIGSIVAALPPLLLALAQGDLGLTMLVLVGYLAANTIFGNFLDPRWSGRGVGISPLVVLLSLLLWGWVLGPVGLLLSVPLTMTIKIALETNPKTHWIAVILGPEKVPAESVETS